MRRHHLVTALLGFAVVLGACGSDEATEADATKDAGVSPMDVPAVVDVPPIDVPRPDLPPVDVPPLDLGPPPDPNICTGNATGQLQQLGGACCYTTPQHPNNPDCVWYADSYGDGECLDRECALGGVCSAARYCTRGCNVFADSIVNATGAQGMDGVSDGAINDCATALDGPMGSDYQCINLQSPDREPVGFCRPGTTFAACESNEDCPSGEVCNLLFILGETQTRCMAPERDGAVLAETCNHDPAEGALHRCQGPFCFGFGCSMTCATDEHCATDTCDAGACAKSGKACTTDSECSAWGCNELTPYSNSDYTDDFCWPKECSSPEGCADPDWFCRPFWDWDGETLESVGFGPACRRREEGLAKYGEVCGTTPDGVEHPGCEWSCVDNYCAGPCKSDDDCSDGTECFVNTEWEIDIDDDEVTDTYTNATLCQPWPHDGELTECSSDADCGDGHHCQHRIKADATGAFQAHYLCRRDTDDTVGWGEVCGGDTGAECKTDICLVPSGDDAVDGMCTQYCASSADCPELVEFGDQVYKTQCFSRVVSHNETPETIDDIYAPYCWRVSSISSLDECGEDRACAFPKEYCRAVPIARGPGDPVTVEHKCFDASVDLEAFPDKRVGEPCETWRECNGRVCLPDGSGGGYCSTLCVTDAACTSPNAFIPTVCTEEVILERPDAANNGVTSRCVMQRTCLSCELDSDCGGDWGCANFGGLGSLAEPRCGKPCDSDDDCDGADELCTDDVAPNGAPRGRKICMASDCSGVE